MTCQNVSLWHLHIIVDIKNRKYRYWLSQDSALPYNASIVTEQQIRRHDRIHEVRVSTNWSWSCLPLQDISGIQYTYACIILYYILQAAMFSCLKYIHTYIYNYATLLLYAVAVIASKSHYFPSGFHTLVKMVIRPHFWLLLSLFCCNCLAYSKPPIQQNYNYVILFCLSVRQLRNGCSVNAI